MLRLIFAIPWLIRTGYWRRLKPVLIGTNKSAKELLTDITRAGMPVEKKYVNIFMGIKVTPWWKTRVAWTISVKLKELNIVQGRGVIKYRDIQKAAERFGLYPCPQDLVLHMRLQYRKTNDICCIFSTVSTGNDDLFLMPILWETAKKRTLPIALTGEYFGANTDIGDWPKNLLYIFSL